MFVVLNKNASLAKEIKTAANDNISYGKLHKTTLNSNLKKKNLRGNNNNKCWSHQKTDFIFRKDGSRSIWAIQASFLCTFLWNSEHPHSPSHTCSLQHDHSSVLDTSERTSLHPPAAPTAIRPNADPSKEQLHSQGLEAELVWLELLFLRISWLSQGHRRARRPLWCSNFYFC